MLSGYLGLGGALGLTWRGLPLSVWKPYLCSPGMLCEGNQIFDGTKILLNIIFWVALAASIFFLLTRKSKNNYE